MKTFLAMLLFSSCSLEKAIEQETAKNINLLRIWVINTEEEGV